MANNALTTKEVSYMANGEEVKLTGGIVRNYLTRGTGNISDQELVMFINLCKYQQLNPFLNEAYMIKFGNLPAQLVVGKEAYMKKAEDHPKYDGLRAGVIIERKGEIIELEGSFTLKGDIILGGWAEVFRSDRKYPLVVKIGIEEYLKKKKDGTTQSTWKSMPKTMIRKVAIVQALREAFPANLGAMYTEEELPQVDVVEATKEEIKVTANTEELDFEAVTIEPEKVEVVEIVEEDKELKETKLPFDDEPEF